LAHPDFLSDLGASSKKDDDMPYGGKRRRSRRKTEEAWIIAITALVLGSLEIIWITSLYKI
jgi:hypothetical protein